MSDGVSVIICCYNSAQRLPEALRHLAVQEVRETVNWEVLVVDNASNDDTSVTAQRNWPESAPAPLRVVTELAPGLSHARIKGINEARYGVISFIDDDNWTAPDWIERVHAHFFRQPSLGACGGRIEAVCEITPPPWFEAVKAHYAIGRQHPRSGDITDTASTLLCGAGLSVRTSAVRALLASGFHFRMSGRKGGLLSAGEDTELCFALRATGWRFWYDDDLVLKHFIPKARLQWSYALALMRGLGESSVMIVVYLIALKSPPFANCPDWKKSWLFQFAKTLRLVFSAVGSHPEAIFGQSGLASVLRLKKATSQLEALWKVRGDYPRLQNEIRGAKWITAASHTTP